MFSLFKVKTINTKIQKWYRCCDGSRYKKKEKQFVLKFMF